MTNTVVFTEGFDKYGPAALSGTTSLNGIAHSQMLNAMRGIWTGSTNNTGSMFIGPPLIGVGIGSFNIVGGANNAAQITATLPANYAKAVGGVYINIRTQRTSNGDAINMRFKDAGTTQAGLGTLVNGSPNFIITNAAGTVVQTSTATYTPNVPFLLEWDITLTASGAYTVWKDGAVILSGTGNFHGSANNFYNQIQLACNGSGTQPNHDMAYDHLYINDGASTALLAQTVIETSFPTADSAVQFADTAYALGYQNSLGTAQTAPGANTMYLRKITIPTGGGGTLNSITIVPQPTSAGANNKGLLYADSAGLPGALLSGGNQVTGTTTNTPVTLPLTTPQAVVAGTSYWIGYMTDTSVALFQSDTLSLSWEKTNTYASGPPNPAGTATSTTFANLILWANITGTTASWIAESEQVSFGAWGDYSYVSDSIVGHEDLFTHTALSVAPNTIYAVNACAYLKDNAAGARTVTINLKSGATDSGGTGFTPGNTVYGWAVNLYPTDPNTAAAWTATNLNSATNGYKITA